MTQTVEKKSLTQRIEEFDPESLKDWNENLKPNRFDELLNLRNAIRNTRNLYDEARNPRNLSLTKRVQYDDKITNILYTGFSLSIRYSGMAKQAIKDIKDETLESFAREVGDDTKRINYIDALLDFYANSIGQDRREINRHYFGENIPKLFTENDHADSPYRTLKKLKGDTSNKLPPVQTTATTTNTSQ